MKKLGWVFLFFGLCGPSAIATSAPTRIPITAYPPASIVLPLFDADAKNYETLFLYDPKILRDISEYPQVKPAKALFAIARNDPDGLNPTRFTVYTHIDIHRATSCLNEIGTLLEGERYRRHILMDRHSAWDRRLTRYEQTHPIGEKVDRAAFYAAIDELNAHYEKYESFVGVITPLVRLILSDLSWISETHRGSTSYVTSVPAAQNAFYEVVDSSLTHCNAFFLLHDLLLQKKMDQYEYSINSSYLKKGIIFENPASPFSDAP